MTLVGEGLGLCRYLAQADFRIVRAINRRGLDLIAAGLRRDGVEVY